MDNCLNDDLITISDLTFSHGDRLLYDRINLTIPRGKVTAVMGQNLLRDYKKVCRDKRIGCGTLCR